MELYKKLVTIQAELKAPKSQYNSFGGFNYRSCEDILSAFKPLAQKYGVTLILSDDVVECGGKSFIKAAATLFNTDNDEVIGNTGWAQIPDSKKGMDVSQITGAASSYARKYALNGLFAIDDTKDADGLPPDESTQNGDAKYKCSQCGRAYEQNEMVKTKKGNIVCRDCYNEAMNKLEAKKNGRTQK